MEFLTNEMRIRHYNDAILRISMALPEYHYVDSLLDYITGEIKQLLGAEGALVILLDEEKGELYFPGASYDNTAIREKVKEIRFPLDQLLAGTVIKTGEPIIVNDTTKESTKFPERDLKFGYHTRNLIEVPLKDKERITGVLCVINKKNGTFVQTDVNLLNMIASTVSLSIENARFSEDLKKAYREVSSLNRAKNKAIFHLSHELKTPVAILTQVMGLLHDDLSSLPDDGWKSVMVMGKRSMARIVGIQEEVADIMQNRHQKAYGLISLLFNQCVDELELLIAEGYGKSDIIGFITKRIKEIFGPKEDISKEIFLDRFVYEMLEKIKCQSSHRSVEIESHFEDVHPIFIPRDVIQKVVDGLIKNALENTPDEGKVEVSIKKRGDGIILEVRDYGVGIIKGDQKRIFEGFFPTQESMLYSTKKPYDFNAGGKGADLLRMNLFSERYNFKININSSRCRFIPKEGDLCPGRISDCIYSPLREDCYNEGGTTFSLFFPSKRNEINSSDHCD